MRVRHTSIVFRTHTYYIIFIEVIVLNARYIVLTMVHQLLVFVHVYQYNKYQTNRKFCFLLPANCQLHRVINIRISIFSINPL